MMMPRMTTTSRRRVSSMDSNEDRVHKIESEDDDGKSDDEEEEEGEDCGNLQDDESKAIARGGVVTPFPWKLHDMLEDAEEEGRDHIVSWQAHGRSFMVHEPKEFVSQIMKKYFNQSKFASFQRQLNLYGFRRLTHGRDKGAYWHECFVRGQRSLCKGMIRQKIKGTKVRKTLAPHEEPDFYQQQWAMSKKQHRKNSFTPTTTTTTTVTLSSSSSPPSPFIAEEEQLQALLPLVVVSPAVERHMLDMAVVTNNEQSTNSDDSPAIVTSSSSSSLEEMEEFVTCEPINPSSTSGVPDNDNVSTYENTKPMQHVKGGDLLYFEGRPFHYLEHLEGILAPHPSSSTSSSTTFSLAAVFCHAASAAPSNHSPDFVPGLVGSLSHMEPDRLCSFNMCTV